jgi:predicted ferric reductase
MRRVLFSFTVFNLALVALFAISAVGIVSLADTTAVGQAFTQFTGFLSLGLMAFSVVLSTRQRWLEPAFGGLDKMYRLHKWLGIGALAIALVHWLVKTGGGHRPPVLDAAAGAVPTFDPAAAASETLFPSLMGPAHMLAQPVLFAMIALVLVALIRLVPYRVFRKFHFVMAGVFVIFAFHSLVLMRPEYWSTPFGWATVALCVLGTLASLYCLVIRFVGFPGVRASVAASRYYPELKVLEAELEVGAAWAGHRPGQFAFVITDRREGAHPFTIATAWNPANRRIGFIAKELGDYTAGLRQQFTQGATVKVEGPYGRFTFDDGRARQIWVGAGIGITPFVAKLREMATAPNGLRVDLFHTTRDVSEPALARLRAEAAAAGIALHIIVTAHDGRLDATRIMAEVADWREAGVWFCGPSRFGADLRRGFAKAGLAPDAFHQELFEMR